MGYPDDERSANDPMHNAETGLPELAITDIHSRTRYWN
jgi:hypothetical protein